MGSRLYSKRMRYHAQKRQVLRRGWHRPKSFKTEEAAKGWAEANKISEYTLKNLKSSESKRKKIVIVPA